MERLGYTVFELDDQQFEAWVEDQIASLARTTRSRVRICVDISSFSRPRIAGIVGACAAASAVCPIDVDFLYAIGRFTSPTNEAIPNAWVGPVSPRFAGWSEEPERPSMLIAGLGYEQDKAVGAVEYLEPAVVWALMPESSDPKYHSAIVLANELLWDSIPHIRQMTYEVRRPLEALMKIEALVFGALRSHRPVLLPLGPKIFALNCLLVACIHRNASVWRVSSGAAERPIARAATGEIVGLGVEFRGGLEAS